MRLNNILNVYLALMVFGFSETLLTTSLDISFGDSSGDGVPDCEFLCKNDMKCIPNTWLCDGDYDCDDLSDEYNCENHQKHRDSHQNKILNISRVSGVSVARKRLTVWILKHRHSGHGTNKWSLQVPRIANALFFEDRNFFQVGNQTGDELRYEITIQALRKLSEMDKFGTPELALYINAMLVTCMNPRDFHGYDLVAELRKRVDAKTFTNPMEILVLCNAGDAMTPKDLDRVNLINETKNHPSWRDTRAIAVITMSCIHDHSHSSKNMMKSMISDLVGGQATNGSVGNLKTTALVLQALIASKKLNAKDFEFETAVRSILRCQLSDGSFNGSLLNSYYVLPVLNHKSLNDINTDHCQRTQRTDKQMIYDSWAKKDRKLKIQLTVVSGKESDVKKAWTLNAPVSSSFYEIMEVVSLMDPKLKINYSIFNGKPFVSSVFGTENDPELGLYWFTYTNSSMESQIVKESPVDFKVASSQELILWYKEGSWRDVQL